MNTTGINEKIFSLFEWIVVASMMVLFSSQFIGLPENNDQYHGLYLNYLQAKPAVFRVLVPPLANALVFFGVHGDWAMATVNFLSGLGAFVFIKRLFARHGVRMWAGLCFALTYALLLNHATPSDWMTVLLFCASFWCMNIGRDELYLLLFPLVVLHRETSILLIALFFLLIYRKATARTLSLWFLQIAIYCIIRGLVMSHFFNSPGQSIYPFTYGVIPTYLSTPAMISALLIVIGAFLVVKARWNIYDHFLRFAIVFFPVQLILHLVLGNPFEFRVLVEFFPVAVLMVFISFSHYRDRSLSPEEYPRYI